MGILSFKRIYQLTIPSFFLIGAILRAYEVNQAWAYSPFFCIFRELTGFDCPGCGMTRSLVSFFSGYWQQSFFFNPIGLGLGLLMCGLWCWSLFSREFYLKTMTSIFPRKHLLSTLLILLSWGVLRNLNLIGLSSSLMAFN